MDAELIGKFITQQVAVAMAEKSREYEKKIKKLEKGGKDKGSGESTSKNGTRGGGRASRKTRHPRLIRTPSLVLLRNLLLSWPHANRASSEALRKENPNKQAQPTAVRQKEGKEHTQRAPSAHQGRHSEPRKPMAPNRAVGQRKGEGKLRFPSRRAPVGKTKHARYTHHNGKVVLFLSSN